MDFISRAGSLIDRGHRIVGILLVVILVQFFWMNSIVNEKEVLQREIYRLNSSQSIYVVPNSQANIYKPADAKLLLTTFVDYITQSMLTYTPANYQKQYESIREFFSSRLLEVADDYYYNQIRKSRTDSLSSLFVIDKTSTELNKFVEEKKLYDKTYGFKTYSINVKGTTYYIVGGTVVESKPQTVEIQLQEATVSKTNPFGFIVTKWTVK